MANNLGSNPWIIDTPGASILHFGYTRIAGLIWSGYTNPADQCIIQGSYNPTNGTQTEVALNGNPNLQEVKIEPATPINFRDFTVPTLTSGRLTVFLS